MHPLNQYELDRQSTQNYDPQRDTDGPQEISIIKFTSSLSNLTDQKKNLGKHALNPDQPL